MYKYINRRLFLSTDYLFFGKTYSDNNFSIVFNLNDLSNILFCGVLVI